MQHRKQWLLLLVIGGIVAGVVMQAPYLQARLLLNRAQLQRLHGVTDSTLYAAAVAQAPDSLHIRWQAAAAAADNNDCPQVIVLLQPVALDPTLPQPAVEMLLSCLLLEGQQTSAVRIYAAMSGVPTLAQGLTARLLYGIATTPEVQPAISTERLDVLLARITGLKHFNPAYRTWSAEYLTGYWWQQPFGEQLRTTLTWRSLPPPAEPEAAAVAPSQQQLAALLQVAPELLTIGDELLDNGRIEGYDWVTGELPGWRQAYWNQGNPHNFGLFVLGVDAAPERPAANAMRIDGLYVNEDPNLAPSRAGFWHTTPITLTARTPYVITFQYRTAQTSADGVALYLTEVPDVIYRNDRRFAPAEAEWQQVTIIGWNNTDQPQVVRPLLRLWGRGTVWFDAVSLREIVLAPGVELSPRDPIIHIAPVSSSES